MSDLPDAQKVSELTYVIVVLLITTVVDDITQNVNIFIILFHRELFHLESWFFEPVIEISIFRYNELLLKPISPSGSV